MISFAGQSVSRLVDLLGEIAAGSVDEAEGGLALVVEPVGQELDAVVILDFQIVEVGRSHIGRAGFVQIVTIHEERHVVNLVAVDPAYGAASSGVAEPLDMPARRRRDSSDGGRDSGSSGEIPPWCRPRPFV